MFGNERTGTIPAQKGGSGPITADHTDGVPHRLCGISVILVVVILCEAFMSPCALFAEAVVLKGNAFPGLIGTPVSHIRICTIEGKPIPFQIDERTLDGEYICDGGALPNVDAGNGILDTADEIVFMREDVQPAAPPGNGPVTTDPVVMKSRVLYPIGIMTDNDRRIAYITADASVKKSGSRYLTYDSATHVLRTPRYYAQFSSNRFHFIRAGITDGSGKKWINLTRELRVEIFLKALWGIIPIRYSEDNLVCYVKRYKVGPIRCIRRGDFHLRLGLGLRGSHASVNQCCYPQMVCVPVYVHVPIKFKREFNEAWMEMTPIIDTAGASYSFNVPYCGIAEPLCTPTGGGDTLISCMPAGRLFTVQHASDGYGWLLTTTIPDSSMAGSGFVVRRKLKRRGIAACGFRLEMRDIERGYYTITNRVLFSSGQQQKSTTGRGYEFESCTIVTQGGTFHNHLWDQ